MSALTIRNLDDDVKHALRKRAAEHGVSMEQEARNILTHETMGRVATRKRPSLEELMKLSRKPAEPFDSKRAQDELWAYLDDDDRR
jgi:plasmid stability protein